MRLTEATEGDKDDRREPLGGESPGGRGDGSSIDIRVEDDLDRAVGCADHGSERSEVRWNGEELCERHLGGEIAATGVDIERRRSHAINIGDR
jgi:hypothetical protein